MCLSFSLCNVWIVRCLLHLGVWRSLIELACGEDSEGSGDIVSAQQTVVIITISAWSVGAAAALDGQANDANAKMMVTGVNSPVPALKSRGVLESEQF